MDRAGFEPVCRLLIPVVIYLHSEAAAPNSQLSGPVRDGARGIRTLDLNAASVVLSQLSYSPVISNPCLTFPNRA